MKSILELIAANIAIPEASHVVVQFWGTQEDRNNLDDFVNVLNKKQVEVTGILFDKEAIITECELGPFNISRQISNETLESATVIIDLCTYSPTSLVQYMSPTSRPNFVSFMRGHFSVITGPNKKMLQIRIPSVENALEAGLSLETYTSVYKEMSMADASVLNQACEALIKSYEAVNEVMIETDGGHTLTLSLHNRTWFKDAGDGDFPAGEIYIAPIETSANGTYKVDYIHWEGQHFNDVVLTFEKGQLVSTSEPQMLEDLKRADENATVIAEFGLGVNPNIKSLTGHSLFDEKMLGSCHIAVGMNHLFGGTNTSVAHMDFVAKSPKMTVLS